MRKGNKLKQPTGKVIQRMKDLLEVLKRWENELILKREYFTFLIKHFKAIFESGGDEDEKKKFYSSKIPIDIHNVDINENIVSETFAYDKNKKREITRNKTIVHQIFINEWACQ